MLFGSTLLGTLSLALALNWLLSTSETFVSIPLIGGQGNQVTKNVFQPTVCYFSLLIVVIYPN
jgi:hypothetical protein